MTGHEFLSAGQERRFVLIGLDLATGARVIFRHKADFGGASSQAAISAARKRRNHARFDFVTGTRSEGEVELFVT